MNGWPVFDKNRRFVASKSTHWCWLKKLIVKIKTCLWALTMDFAASWKRLVPIHVLLTTPLGKTKKNVVSVDGSTWQQLHGHSPRVSHAYGARDACLSYRGFAHKLPVWSLQPSNHSHEIYTCVYIMGSTKLEVEKTWKNERTQTLCNTYEQIMFSIFLANGHDSGEICALMGSSCVERGARQWHSTSSGADCPTFVCSDGGNGWSERGLVLLIDHTCTLFEWNLLHKSDLKHSKNT